MRRLFLLGCVLLFSLAWVTTVVAEEKKEKGTNEAGVQMQEKGKAKAAIKKFAGKVVSFDAATKTLVVKRDKHEKIFDVANAKLAANTKLEDLKNDDRIAVKYVIKDDKNVATAVAKAPK